MPVEDGRQVMPMREISKRTQFRHPACHAGIVGDSVRWPDGNVVEGGISGAVPLSGFLAEHPRVERLDLGQEPIQHAAEALFERFHAIGFQDESIDVAEHVPEAEE